MDQFLKNATVVRVVDGRRVEAGPISRSTFSEHVNKHDRFGKVPKKNNTAPTDAIAAANAVTSGTAGTTKTTAKAPATKRRKTATSVGSIEHATTVSEAMDIRTKEVQVHEQEIRALHQKLIDVEQQLSSTQRTRRNVALYKRLIDRRDAVRAEISRKRNDMPSMTEVTRHMMSFYEKAEQHAARGKECMDVDGPAANEKGTNGDGGDDDEDRKKAMAIQFNDANVPRITEVTFGAPLIESHEYARLESMLRTERSDVDDNDNDNDEDAAKTAEFQYENAFSDIDQAFDEAVRADVTSHALHEVQVLAYIISPATRGWSAVEEEDLIESNCATQNKKAVALGKKLLDSRPNLEMITIGSNRAQMPTGSKIRNRLNIKNKEIRNMENVSMLNFCRVKKRKRTNEERETIEFVRYIGRRHYTDAERPVSYDDPECTNCGTALDINMRTGMETCHKCGLTVYGGTGREIIPLEQPMHNKYQYLKVGHMKTILKRSQGKETTRIPQKVPNDVTRQLKMERADFDTIDAFRVKKTLKKLGYSKWYDHMHQITHIVTGRRPHQFSQFEEEVILSIFEHLVEPYERHRPKNQENFPVSLFILFISCCVFC